ncbi:rhomboid family intramembrane serine protease [Cytobacillus oceanisediminis]
MDDPRADGAQRCYRHPDREAYISCQRCERPICPDDMRDASVGFQCPECVNKGAKAVRAPRTVAGGAVQTREGIVSMTLIVVNVTLYVLQMATGDLRSELYQQGTMWPFGVAEGQYWRLLTSAFLHLSVLHIAFNMYALYLFGPFVERALGTVRFIAAYVTTAVVSGVFVLWLSNPLGGTAGASGAVFGLFGMALVLLLKARQDVRGLLVLLAINGAISFTGNISWQGHLGGFVAGCLLGLVFAYAPRERRTLVQVLAFTGIWVAVVVAVALRTASLTA